MTVFGGFAMGIAVMMVGVQISDWLSDRRRRTNIHNRRLGIKE